jgi:hypothetical protein
MLMIILIAYILQHIAYRDGVEFMIINFLDTNKLLIILNNHHVSVNILILDDSLHTATQEPA